MQLAGDKQIEIISGKDLELCRKACEVSYLFLYIEYYYYYI